MGGGAKESEAGGANWSVRKGVSKKQPETEVGTEMRRTHRPPILLLPAASHLTVVAGRPLSTVGVQDSLPLAYLADALLAAKIFLDIGRARRVVELVPVRLERDVVCLFPLLAPAAALPLLA